MAVPTYQVILTENDGFTQVDITDYVLSVNISRGRSRELERFNAGTVNVTLNNRNRYFDPKYTSSPYANYLTPKVAIAILSNDIYVFNGYVQDWNYSYDVSGESVANVTGVDFLAYLAQMSLVADTPPSQSTGDRLQRIFGLSGNAGIVYPPIHPGIVFDAGKRTLQADTIAAGTNVLEYAQLVEKTEGGYFYIDAYGVMNFRETRNLFGNGQIFTDAGTTGSNDFAYQNIEIVYGSELLYNNITLTRAGGASANVIKQSSIDRFGSLYYSDDNYLHAYDSDTTKQALLLAAKFSEPEYRFESISVMLNPLSFTKQQSLCQIDLSYLVNVIFTPNGVGSAISKTVRVIGMDHTMTPDSHIITYKFESVENEQMILDDTTFGSINWNVLGF